MMPRRCAAPRVARASSRYRRAVAAVAIGAATAIAAMSIVVGSPGTAGAQSVASLRERAQKVAAELDALDERTNALDEELNSAQLELDGLNAKLAANQAEVDAARSKLSATRSEAHEVAVQAYVGDNQMSDLPLGSGDIATDSRRRAYLSTKMADSQEVIDDLVASQKDLADSEASLSAARGKVDAKLAQVKESRAAVERTVADRRALAESVQGELAAALQAEQERLAREAAARAERDARAAAAAQAAAASRPRAVAVGAGGRVTAAAPARPRVITPPPANAPIAVQVAMEQQGDPYRWAASGPNSFDCSGLVMFAYKAAGISLPHSSRALRSMSRSLSPDELQPGDLVFGGSPVHHVGIYIGNGQMVHAPHSGTVVKVSGMYQTSKPVSFGRL